MNKGTLAATTLLAVCLVSTANAGMNDIDVGVGGFIRFDYGNGDRYALDGDDHIGISKVALALSAKKDNVEVVFVLGSEPNSNTAGTGNVETKDAFLVIHDAAPGLNFSLGAQPFLFGLKPNGYPSDRSIIGSVEYGAGGAAGISGQAGPSAIAQYHIGSVELRLGIFEGTGDVAASDNSLLQLRYSHPGSGGFYGVVGVESLDGDKVSTLGLGFDMGMFDISAEAFMLDQDAVVKAGGNAVTDDETYTVLELTYNSSANTSFYVDVSNADVAEIDAVRVGAILKAESGLVYRLEWSSDEIGTESVDSVDFRVAFNF